jgi:hypothetical protein
MKRFAVIMAVEEYADAAYSSTVFCHADAKLLRDTLISFCDYAEQDILLELLEPDSDVSPKSIIERITEVGARSAAGDTILFFYAGHGGLFENEPMLILPNTKPANKHQTALPFRDISAALRLSGRTNVRVFDTCHSGLDVRASSDGTSGDSELDVPGLVRSVSIGTEEGWITFAACKGDESSHPDGAKKQGIFTWAFCEALKEASPGEDILPELVKVAVCRKVAEWCRMSGRVQTPSFNSAISGNVTIGHRRNAQPAAQSVVPAPAPLVLSDRVARLKGKLLPGAKQYNERLATIIGFVETTTTAHAPTLEAFGAELKIAGPKDVYALPSELRPELILYVGRNGWRPIHRVESREVTGERQPTMYERMEGYHDLIRTRRTEHAVEQPPRFPNSLVTATLQPTGIVPRVFVFFYLLPLQLRVSLVAGIALSGTVNFAEEKLRLRELDCVILDADSDHTDRVRDYVIERLQRFHSIAMSAISERLDVLEAESGLVQVTPNM